MSVRCVLVTGSREWDDVWAVKAELEAAVAEAVTDGIGELIVRHGACYPRYNAELGRRPHKSADYLAHLWIVLYGPQQPIGIVEQRRPADWTGPCRPSCPAKPRRGQTRKHRQTRPDGTTWCPAAGAYRNREMLLEQPQPYRGLAFRLDGSPGTTDCIEAMRDLSIPVDPVDRVSEAGAARTRPARRRGQHRPS